MLIKKADNSSHLENNINKLSLGPMTSLAMSFYYVYNTRHEIPPVQQASNLIKRETGNPNKQYCHYYTSGHILLDKPVLYYAGSSTV